MIKRKFNPLPAVLALLLFPMLISAQERPAKYIVLITIDGLRPEFYLDPSWGMVNLRCQSPFL